VLSKLQEIVILELETAVATRLVGLPGAVAGIISI